MAQIGLRDSKRQTTTRQLDRCWSTASHTVFVKQLIFATQTEHYWNKVVVKLIMAIITQNSTTNLSQPLLQNWLLVLMIKPGYCKETCISLIKGFAHEKQLILLYPFIPLNRQHSISFNHTNLLSLTSFLRKQLISARLSHTTHQNITAEHWQSFDSMEYSRPVNSHVKEKLLFKHVSSEPRVIY